MFERYTEKARRVIFFARYEASQHGMPEIDTPCLLLGILRDDKDLMSRLLPSPSGSEELAGIVPAGPKELARLSADVEALFPKTDQEIATNVDLPVSHQATFALACAAEEAVGLGHKSIDPRHLLLGLLRANGPEAACLKAHGIEPERVRADFAQGGKIDAPGAPPQPALAPEWARRYMELVRVLQCMPADRREAAATLLEGLASGKFEVTGTSRNGPFHFSFDDKTE
jgi:ATP-dependent Clp protease ATP-binding subunit ClpC